MPRKKRKNASATTGGIDPRIINHPKNPPKLRAQGIRKYSTAKTANIDKIRSMPQSFISFIEQYYIRDSVADIKGVNFLFCLHSSALINIKCLNIKFMKAI